MGGDGADVLIGGAGRDRAAYWSAKDDLRIDLMFENNNTGEAAGDTYLSIEDLQGGKGADDLRGDNGANRIHGGDKNDVLHGRGGNDNLYGQNGNDILLGGAGADRLDGGSGRDRAAYWSAKEAVVADLATRSANTGEAAGDIYISIEDLQGSKFNDKLRGSSVDNRLHGGNGNDELHGRGGADLLYGQNGNDILLGGTGADRIDGGSGIDRAAYWTSKAGLTADLANSAANTGDAAGDIYVSIENLQGTTFDDILNGDAGNNWIIGSAGADVLNGRGGIDTLTGGTGADRFVFAHADATDRVADFEFGSDALDISAWGATNFSDLSVSETDVGNNYDLTISYAGYGLMLDNVSASDRMLLDADDFVFI
ncbi:MAG: calcium-binding protein [Pseudomonadota bacterium]